MIGSGISQTMDSVFIPIIDKLFAVDPWVQQQAAERIANYKKVLAEGGHCPYSGLHIPPPE